MHKRKLRWDEWTGILLFGVSAVLLGISVFLCFCGDIWYDELFSMGFVNLPLRDMIAATARDVHPPFYYMIVKLFLGISGMSGAGIHQAAAAKLASVLPFFFCMSYAMTGIRRRFGLFPAGFFSFLLMSMPALADYTVEIRMYGWALFFITAGMVHAFALAEGEKGQGKGQERGQRQPAELRKETPEQKEHKKDRWNWIALTLYALAACYTHYFACAAACMIYLYLLLVFLKEHRPGRQWRLFWASGIFCAAAYLPWIAGAAMQQVGQVKENYWIQPLTWRSLGGCVKFIFQPSFSGEKVNVLLTAVLFLIYGALMILLVIRQIRERAGSGNSGGGKQSVFFFICSCIGVLAGVVAFGFLISFLIRPIFVYRYMLPAMGVFWLAFALLVSELLREKHPLSGINIKAAGRVRRVLLLGVVLLFVIVGLRNYRAFYGEEMWKRVQMRQAREMLSQIGEEDILVFNFDQAQAVFSFYLDNESYLWYGQPEELIREMYPQNHPLVEGEFSDEAGIRRLRELLSEGRKVWFLGSGNARDEIIEKWQKSGIETAETGSVMIERYWVNLYSCNEKRVSKASQAD